MRLPDFCFALFLATASWTWSHVNAKEFLRFCYVPSWANVRPSPVARFDIQDIDPTLCSHVIYAFGKLDRTSKLLVAASPLVEDSRPGYVGRFEQLNNLKRGTGLKTLLSIGGQNEYGDGFDTITENDVIIQRFAQNAAKFLRDRKFDGLDIDWEYPTKNSKNRFVKLLKALREAFDSGDDKLILTVAGPAGQQYIDAGYDVPNIARYIDYMLLMTYDYTVSTSQVAAFNSPLFSRHNIQFNPTLSTNWTVHYWNARGLAFNQMVIGVTGVGRRLVLENVNMTDVGASVTGEIRRGDFYGFGGGLAYPEICVMLDAMGTERFFDYEQKVPYLIKGDDWVGYEDEESLAVKVPWMMRQGAAGIMFWSIDQDDFSGKMCDAGQFPLLTAIHDAIEKEKEPQLTDDVNKNINFITKVEDGAQTLTSTYTILVFASLHLLIFLLH